MRLSPNRSDSYNKFVKVTQEGQKPLLFSFMHMMCMQLERTSFSKKAFYCSCDEKRGKKYFSFIVAQLRGCHNEA